MFYRPGCQFWLARTRFFWHPHHPPLPHRAHLPPASIQVQGVDPNKFAAFNVFEDSELRQGIKKYSD